MAQQAQLRNPEGVVPDSDAQALVAYLGLLAKVFREGSAPSEGSSTSPVIAWMHVLEEETGARPLWEVMIQLMCHPVPQVRLISFALSALLASIKAALPNYQMHTLKLSSRRSAERQRTSVGRDSAQRTNSELSAHSRWYMSVWLYLLS